MHAEQTPHEVKVAYSAQTLLENKQQIVYGDSWAR